MRLAAAAAACLALAVAPLWAQDGDPQEPAGGGAAATTGVPEGSPGGQTARPPAPPRFVYKLGQSIRTAAVPHIDGGGDAVTTLTRTDFTLTWLASQRTRAIFDASNEFAFYDFDGASKVDPVAGDPFGSFTRQNLDVLVSHNLTRRWVVLGVGGVGLSRERNADVGDAVVWRAGLGATYYLTERISLGASLLVQSQLEGGVEVLPLPQVDATFRFDEQWSLKLATIGGATLAYQATEELGFNLKLGYQERQYRLDDEGLAPRGVFQDKSVDLNLGVSWQPTPGLEVTAGVGSQLWRRFKIKDEDGGRVSRSETDPTLMLHAGLSYRF
ncbi:MAG: DUF6268 family outer membrane beta-barrel protein [Phycisphaerales bacterium JB060]